MVVVYRCALCVLIRLKGRISYKNLMVWKRAARLSVGLYRGLANLKDYGFRDQLTRSGLSIASNIAEGYGRGGCKEIQQFLRYAKGSAAEVETQVYIGAEIGYIAKADAQAWVIEAQEIQSMLAALIKHVATQTSRKND